MESTHFGKHSLIFILDHQRVSHMKAAIFSSNLIPCWGQSGWNCGLGRSPKWTGSRRQKSSIKNSKICNFWATQTLCTSKESWEQSVFRIEVEYLNFYWKCEKNISAIFDEKNRKKNFGSQVFIIFSKHLQKTIWYHLEESLDNKFK